MKYCSKGCLTTWDLISFLNENEIPKENIIEIFPLKDMIMLIYYK